MNAQGHKRLGEILDLWSDSGCLGPELHGPLGEIVRELLPHHQEHAVSIAAGAAEVALAAIQAHQCAPRKIGPQKMRQRVRGAVLRYLADIAIELALKR